ncbi:hypothetical protein G9A89_003068 [Geosiphon pyriformis]|nr:hypothetical protein G9A89_003068 [Geosiphon pyriformis]
MKMIFFKSYQTPTENISKKYVLVKKPSKDFEQESSNEKNVDENLQKDNNHNSIGKNEENNCNMTIPEIKITDCTLSTKIPELVKGDSELPSSLPLLTSSSSSSSPSPSPSSLSSSLSSNINTTLKESHTPSKQDDEITEPNTKFQFLNISTPTPSINIEIDEKEYDFLLEFIPNREDSINLKMSNNLQLKREKSFRARKANRCVKPTSRLFFGQHH